MMRDNHWILVELLFSLVTIVSCQTCKVCPSGCDSVSCTVCRECSCPVDHQPGTKGNQCCCVATTKLGQTVHILHSSSSSLSPSSSPETLKPSSSTDSHQLAIEVSTAVGAALLCMLMALGVAIGVIKIRRLQLETVTTLPPWPQRNANVPPSVNNPIYGVELEDSDSPPVSGRSPPVYEEIDTPPPLSPSPMKVLHNPLYAHPHRLFPTPHHQHLWRNAGRDMRLDTHRQSTFSGESFTSEEDEDELTAIGMRPWRLLQRYPGPLGGLEEPPSSVEVEDYSNSLPQEQNRTVRTHPLTRHPSSCPLQCSLHYHHHHPTLPRQSPAITERTTNGSARPPVGHTQVYREQSNCSETTPTTNYYSQLNSSTQYACLEPFTGSTSGYHSTHSHGNSSSDKYTLPNHHGHEQNVYNQLNH